MDESKRSFWSRAKSFFEHRGWRIISADDLEHLRYEEKESARFLSAVCELQERLRFLETEFLKRHKPSELLGVIFKENVCPHYNNQVAMTCAPNLPRGTCIKYGSYGHINLHLPWGMPLCTLEDADTCPIFNHATPYTYGIKYEKKAYGSRWWPHINGKEEQIALNEDFDRIWTWLSEKKKAECQQP